MMGRNLKATPGDYPELDSPQVKGFAETVQATK
jgi:hypothetical protein